MPQDYSVIYREVGSNQYSMLPVAASSREDAILQAAIKLESAMELFCSDGMLALEKYELSRIALLEHGVSVDEILCKADAIVRQDFLDILTEYHDLQETQEPELCIACRQDWLDCIMQQLSAR